MPRTKTPATEHGCSGRAPGKTQLGADYAAFAGTGAFCSAGLTSMRIP